MAVSTASMMPIYLRQGLGTPLLLLLMLAMIVVPLPSLLLDILFTFSISLALVVLLVTVYTPRPLDFAIFPVMLLLATLLRLGLNVASTRVVLLRGHTGSDAAGQVISAFGDFVVGGNYVVGLVVFIVLVIINFVVVTKGAGRISEVTARFVLDAMPGKQMAIDADLGAGLISPDDARHRRAEISSEADFYGAMDGASKFVRGDAIAGILIVVINILGGFAIGTLQHGLPISEAARHYTLLTIGDGLVAQIPSLLLSTSAALMVTRVSDAQDMGQQIMTQLFGSPKALAVTALVVGSIGLLPGMPNVAFLSIALVTGSIAYMIAERNQASEQAPVEDVVAPMAEDSVELGWDEITPVDPIGLEVGYKLVPLVNKEQGGKLMHRIKGVRKKLTQEIGFLVPSVHIRDNLSFAPDAYQISLYGSIIGHGAVYPEKDLAISSGDITASVPGIQTKDPTFGLPALWIEPAYRERAQEVGYTVVDAATVVATHLSQLIQDHSHELLRYEDTRELLDRLSQISPKLIEDLTPKLLPLSVVHRVLQNLLQEKVSIRDIRMIAESLTENAAQSKESDALTAMVRITLGRTIVQKINGMSTELPVITLEQRLEQLLLHSIQAEPGGGVVEPGLIEKLSGLLTECVERQELLGQDSTILVSPGIRQWLARFVRYVAPGMHVLSYSEIPGNIRIRIIESIGSDTQGNVGKTTGMLQGSMGN
jgi:flagellar biosynthesis protein FlhA